MRDPKHVAGITGRDFSDIFRQFAFYERVGYPMHHTGMLDAAVLAWNHHHPCTAAFACLWHNQARAGRGCCQQRSAGAAHRLLSVDQLAACWLRSPSLLPCRRPRQTAALQTLAPPHHRRHLCPQVAHYSMRVQANVMFVLSALGLTDTVRFLGPLANEYIWPANVTLEPTGFPAWGQLKYDAAWRR